MHLAEEMGAADDKYGIGQKGTDKE